MTAPTTLAAARSRRFSTAEASVLLIVAAAAWLVTIAAAGRMGVMAGPMGLGLVAFLGVWTLMMTAMMLPSVAPLSSLYARTMRDHRVRRGALLVIGYLAVWAAAGLGAFVFAVGAERLADEAPGWAQAAAVLSCVACGLYQLTGLKDRCLQHCRSPLGHLLRYASFRGPLVEARVGVDHGLWCLGCCWALMVLLVTFGVMNVVAMVVLAAVIAIEKVLAPGRWFSVAVGMVAFGLAAAVWIDPSLAPGLHTTSEMPMGAR